MTFLQRFVKRGFDIVFAILGLLVLGWLIVFGWLIAAFDTRRSGFFVQVRVGRHGRHFKLVKLRTMRENFGVTTTVTTRSDVRITKVGHFLRRTKVDELPQLFNVLVGVYRGCHWRILWHLLRKKCCHRWLALVLWLAWWTYGHQLIWQCSWSRS